MTAVADDPAIDETTREEAPFPSGVWVSASDVIDRVTEELVARRDEIRATIRPLNRELARVEAGIFALKTGRARGGQGTGRRGRPPGSGTRAHEALTLVKEQPGITIPQIAGAMGIKDNYLYRVMPQLAAEGKVHKKWSGWYPGAES